MDKHEAYQDVRHHLRQWEQALAAVDEVHAKHGVADNPAPDMRTLQSDHPIGMEGVEEIRRVEYRALCKWEELKEAAERWRHMTVELQPRLELEEILDTLRAEMPNLEKSYHVKSLGVFGPYATGKNGPDSVLNLVVEYHKLPGLIGLAELEDHIGELLGVKVDLGHKDSLRPHVKDWVLSELVEV